MAVHEITPEEREQMMEKAMKNMKIKHGETRIGVEFNSLQPQLTDTIGKYLYFLG